MIRINMLAFVLLVSFGALVLNANATDLSKRPDEWFGSAEGRKTMDCILTWQSDHGDWPKNKDTISKPYDGDRAKLQGTFDNGATTGELRALARAYNQTGDKRYELAFLKGLDHILRAQYTNGGWPQYFPLRKGYYTHITFNDNCMIRIMEFLRDTSSEKEFSFIDNDRRMGAKRAVDLGMACILKCQTVIKGTLTVWCAQHDEVSFAPTSARAYELASLSGSESAGILKFLMNLDNPSPEVVRAVKAGVAWFETSKIKGIRIEKVDGDRIVVADQAASPVWARFYELETNRPFFCDRDGVPKYTLKEIGSERRNGYAWYGNWGESVAAAFAKWPYK